MNLTYGVKYIDPWSKSPWSHTDIQRMRQGLIGCQVGNNTMFTISLSQLDRKEYLFHSKALCTNNKESKLDTSFVRHKK